MTHDLFFNSLFQQQDIDYQTETNSMTSSWFGFHDSHSYIARYKVGLGVSPGDDDLQMLVYSHVSSQMCIGLTVAHCLKMILNGIGAIHTII